MEFEKFNYQLLARYVGGKCTTREQEKIEEWADSHPENRKRLEQFKRIYSTSEQKGDIVQDQFDAELQWEELVIRLKTEDEFDKKESKDDHQAAHRTSSLHSATQKIMRVAAIFLVAGLIGVFAYQNGYQDPEAEEPVLREVSTANAQRANLTLGDGTKVMLNAGSKIKFPNRFGKDVREVYLEGEAYFDVVNNPEKPFIVHLRGSVIRVLGTSFAVRSYDEEDHVRVVVSEGEVSFETENTDDKIFLEARELGRYYFKERKLETARVTDMQLYMSWRDGYLKFREEPMRNVAKELERRYGVEVTFKNPGIKEKSLTAFLKSRSIKNVLEVVAMSLDVEYRLQEDTVSFYIK